MALLTVGAGALLEAHRHRSGDHDPNRPRAAAVRADPVELHIPVGTMVTGTSVLSAALGAPFLGWCAVALSGLLRAGWLTAATRTARGTWNGSPRQAPADPRPKAVPI